MIVGLQELRTVFSTYEQFVGPLCNVFKIYNVRRSLWNGTQEYNHNKILMMCIKTNLFLPECTFTSMQKLSVRLESLCMK